MGWLVGFPGFVVQLSTVHAMKLTEERDVVQFVGILNYNLVHDQIMHGKLSEAKARPA